jgi:hypothetical protein
LKSARRKKKPELEKKKEGEIKKVKKKNKEIKKRRRKKEEKIRKIRKKGTKMHTLPRCSARAVIRAIILTRQIQL